MASPSTLIVASMPATLVAGSHVPLKLLATFAHNFHVTALHYTTFHRLLQKGLGYYILIEENDEIVCNGKNLMIQYGLT
ncbi:hypothetical protein F4802DRAFT_121179 [Xylaria palmicola]|nr:hypothetical protein F4802DRAFT_121179 [Xylaria palmicola]